jgi:hypothetical protein
MTLTEKYGQPQGNELVYGKDIIRRTDTFEFSVIDRFMSNKEANSAYEKWIRESGLRTWTYSRPIVGTDKNGFPIWFDSWGKKINESN